MTFPGGATFKIVIYLDDIPAEVFQIVEKYLGRHPFNIKQGTLITITFMSNLQTFNFSTFLIELKLKFTNCKVWTRQKFTTVFFLLSVR